MEEGGCSECRAHRQLSGDCLNYLQVPKPCLPPGLVQVCAGGGGSDSPWEPDLA